MSKYTGKTFILTLILISIGTALILFHFLSGGEYCTLISLITAFYHAKAHLDNRLEVPKANSLGEKVETIFNKLQK